MDAIGDACLVRGSLPESSPRRRCGMRTSRKVDDADRAHMSKTASHRLPSLSGRPHEGATACTHLETLSGAKTSSRVVPAKAGTDTPQPIERTRRMGPRLRGDDHWGNVRDTSRSSTRGHSPRLQQCPSSSYARAAVPSRRLCSACSSVRPASTMCISSSIAARFTACSRQASSSAWCSSWARRCPEVRRICMRV